MSLRLSLLAALIVCTDGKAQSSKEGKEANEVKASKMVDDTRLIIKQLVGQNVNCNWYCHSVIKSKLKAATLRRSSFAKLIQFSSIIVINTLLEIQSSNMIESP